MAINPVNPGDIGNPNTLAGQSVGDIGNPSNKTAQAVGDVGNPNNKTAAAVGDIGNPNNKTAATVGDIGNPNNKTAAAVGDVGNPNTLTAAPQPSLPRTIRSVLNLDFQNGLYSANEVTKNFSDLVDYSRASAASFISFDKDASPRADYYIAHDFDGTITNLALYSEQFDHATWSKDFVGSASAPVVTANAASAPDGTMTASRAVFSIASPVIGNRSVIRQSITVSNDVNTSIWVKSYSGAIQYVNIARGGGTSTSIKVDEKWRRVDAYIPNGAGSADYGIELRGGLGSSNTTADVLIWGAQVTNSVKAQPYVKTMSSQQSTIKDATPRFEYSPSKGKKVGFLIEGSSTNLILRSELFDDPAWSKTTASIVINAAVAPDLTETADKIVGDNAASLSSVSQSISKAASVLPYVFSVFAKPAEFNRLTLLASGASSSDFIQATVDLATGQLVGAVSAGGSFSTSGSEFTSIKIGGGWWRFAIKFNSDNSANIVSRLYPKDSVAGDVGNGSSGVYVWGAQLEQKDVLTSYIVTTSSQQSRAADFAFTDSSNAPDFGENSVGINFDLMSVSASFTHILLRQAVPTGNFLFRSYGGVVDAVYGDMVAASFASAQNQTQYESMWTYDGALLRGYGNGEIYQTSADGAPPSSGSYSLIRIGHDGSNWMYGHISSISIFNESFTSHEVKLK